MLTLASNAKKKKPTKGVCFILFYFLAVQFRILSLKADLKPSDVTVSMDVWILSFVLINKFMQIRLIKEDLLFD